MRLRILTTAFVLAFSHLAGAQTSDSSQLRTIHQKVGPSVVRVDSVVRKQLDNGVDVDLESHGIGVVVQKRLVMTPSDLFKESAALGSRITSIRVTIAGGKTFDAKLRGMDAATSLAFLSLADDGFEIAPIEFAKNDALDVGDFFATLRLAGPSFRSAPYIDAFMVSAAIADPKCYVTTYAISDYLGAPVVAFDGRIVGIVNHLSLLARTPKSDPVTGERSLDLLADIQGYDNNGDEIVVVPASRFASLVAQPPENATQSTKEPVASVRGWLGIESQVLLPELAAALGVPQARMGVLLTRVMPDSPAANAGLRSGDLLFAIDGEALHCKAEGDQTELSSKLGAHAPGDVIALSYRRGETEDVAKAQLVAAPAQVNDAKKAESPAFGITARDLVYSDRADLDLPSDAKGARATIVKRTGFAGLAGVRVGDIVREVDGASVADATDLSNKLATAAAAHAATISLFVTRGADTLFLEVHPDWKATASGSGR